jgi:plasmid stabilization system protein ParE
MTPVYSRRALADLQTIGAYFATVAGPPIAQAIEQRLTEVIDRICLAPLAAPLLAQRSNLRVVPVISYPFRIFYRVRRNSVEIVHIRHTSRRPIAAP